MNTQVLLLATLMVYVWLIAFSSRKSPFYQNPFSRAPAVGKVWSGDHEAHKSPSGSLISYSYILKNMDHGLNTVQLGSRAPDSTAMVPYKKYVYNQDGLAKGKTYHIWSWIKWSEVGNVWMRAISQLNGGFVFQPLLDCAGSRRTLCPLLTSLNPPRQSNLINPTNPNKKSHKSKSKLHKSRKMPPAEFLPVRRFCPKNLILGIKAQGQRVDRA